MKEFLTEATGFDADLTRLKFQFENNVLTTNIWKEAGGCFVVPFYYLLLYEVQESYDIESLIIKICNELSYIATRVSEPEGLI